MIGYGVNSFRMKFKKVFGIPAYEWLMQEKSKRLLVAIANSEDDFKNIIDEFDFSSHSHFYKFCKARFGYSPTELRKNLNRCKKHPLSEYTFKLSSCITPNKLYSFIFASLILDTYPYG